jgi:putative copper resistance protein D
MAGLADVLLRGFLLVSVIVAVGGVAWLRVILAVEPWAKPDGAARASLRLVAAAALLAAVLQAATLMLVLGELGPPSAGIPLGAFLDSTFARVALARVVIAAGLATMALRLAARPAGRPSWVVLFGLAGTLVLSSAALSHATARLSDRALLFGVDAVHQLAVAVWIGGLAHLALHAARTRAEPDPRARAIARRFSTLALASVATLVLAGLALTAFYVGDPAALVGTAYGVMVLSKVALLVGAGGFGYANYRLVHRTGATLAMPTLARRVEVELGLGLTVVFAAASLTSLPPAVDVSADRATVAEVTARFAPGSPRLTSPPIAELLQAADPLMAPPGERHPVERAWSEFNHHWAGLTVLAMGLLAAAERLGVRAGRHWPLALVGLAAFLFARNDPRAWPLGPAGFWESMMLPDVLQHRAFVVLIVAFGVFEWAVRTRRLAVRPWGYVFPLLCAVGSGLLLTHSHAMFSLKEEFLTEVAHAPLGLLGAAVGWGRWLELRLPEAGPGPGWVWRGALIVVGLLLLFYHEG